jgi:hypothetical protein
MKTVEERLANIEAMLEILVKRHFEPETSDEVGVEEAARICHVTVKTLYTYVNKGVLYIPAIRRGKKLFWKRDDLIRWNADRTYKVIKHHLKEN